MRVDMNKELIKQRDIHVHCRVRDYNNIVCISVCYHALGTCMQSSKFHYCPLRDYILYNYDAQ